MGNHFLPSPQPSPHTSHSGVCAPGSCCCMGRLQAKIRVGSGWAGPLTCCVLAPDSGRLPKASLVSIVLGALLVGGLAGLAWTVIGRW